MIVPLRVRSGYSLLAGTAGPEVLLSLAKKMGYAQLALTDINGLYGLTGFYKLAQSQGIEPIVGAELVQGGQWVVALVHNEQGYENLCKLLTRIHGGLKERDQGPGTRDQENDHRREQGTTGYGLLATGHSFRGLHLIVDSPELAAALLRADVDHSHVWLGIDPSCQSRVEIRRIFESAGRLGIGRVAMGAALLARAEDGDVARLLAAIRTGKTFDTVDARELPPAKAYLRGPRELAGELSALAALADEDEPPAMRDFADAVANNQHIAKECAAYRLLPRKPVFPAVECPDGQTASAYLRRLCLEGAHHRYGQLREDVQERMDRELSLIEKMGFCEYFLVVWDIVRYARSRGAPVAGRGSGASSLVAYVLGITNVCPIAFNIPFERFLHEGREDFPDLDIDFCWRIRDDVIAYAFRRWGADHAAMVSMHGTFQPASAMRETAKAFGMSDAQILKLENGQNMASRITELARRIIGLPHTLSVHPGGIVLSPRTIDHYTPIQWAAKGVPITQYDKNGVEDIRLVKLDLLGNRNLSTIRYAAGLIRSRRGIPLDVEALPGDDAATLRTLREAQTVGCNQLESPAMRHLLRMMQPRCIADVMKALALIRPGAASIGMKEVFVRRHRGLDAVPSELPAVAAVLGDTHGVMLYEDDVMLVAAVLLGGSLSQADRFRKAIQKCHDDQWRLELSREFLDRCRDNGVELEYAKGLWVQMAKFNAYSFCRAHAASYALLAYAGAYLKTHYPLESWTAAMNNNQSMYPLRVYVEQAKRAGLQFLLPDANKSEAEFAIEELSIADCRLPIERHAYPSRDRKGADRPACIAKGIADDHSYLPGAIRVGLGHIAGLGPAAVTLLLQTRKGKPFESLSDCLYRTGLGATEARSMVLCGAFDWTARARSTLMMELNLFYSLGAWRHSKDVLLLSAGPNIPDVPGDYSPRRKYFDQRRILGFSTGEHLMTLCRPAVNRELANEHAQTGKSVLPADSRDLPGRLGRRVRIAGLIEAQRSTSTDSGKPMMFLTMEDEHGLFEVTLFPDACRNLSARLRYYGPYIITGMVESQYDSLTLTAEDIQYVGYSIEEGSYQASAVDAPAKAAMGNRTGS